MLDTNILSDLIRNPQGKAARRIAKAGEDNICTSIIVAAELRYGCAKSGSPPAREGARAPIGGNDLLIAAHARAIGAIIVTANAGEFGRVRGLRMENWLA